MSLKKYITLATLTACLLASPALGSKKKPVERPFKCEAIVTWTVNMLDGSATGYHLGEATHGGLFSSDASAVWDLGNFVIVSATGVGTVANGDQLFWKMTPDQLMAVQWTGGTGRFERATGGWITTSLSVVAMQPDWETMTLTMTLAYTGEGTICY
jgi:hypothetical protein